MYPYPHSICGISRYRPRIFSNWAKILLMGLVFWTNAYDLTAQHDVSLIQSVNTSTAQEGDTLIFTLTIINENSTDLTGVQVQNTLPTSLTYVDHLPVSETYDSGSGIWNIGNIAASIDSLSLNIRAVVTGTGVAYNLAEVAAMNETDDDSTPGNGSYFEDDIANACVSIPIKICPILLDTFTLRAPAGLTNYQWYVDSSGTREAIAGANSDSYDATRPGAYSFEADQNTCPAGSCCPVILEEECDLEYDLALIKTASPQSVFLGDTINYTITIANQGNVNSNQFSVMDTIPEGLAFVDADNGGTLSGNIVNWTIPNLQADSLMNITVRLEVIDTSFAPFRNWAEITDDSSEDYGLTDEDSTPDTDPTNDLVNDHDDINLDVPPGDADDSDYEDVFLDRTEYDLALIKTADKLRVWPGDTINYTITIANQGNVNSNLFTVEDIIPGGMTFISADNGGTESGGIVTWKFNNLLPDSILNLTLQLRIDDETQSPFRNWAEITDDSSEDYRTNDEDSTPDNDPNNDQVNNHNDITLDTPGGDEDDSDFEEVEILVPEYDLALIKTANPHEAAFEDVVTYTITIANQGAVPSNDFIVYDVFPVGMSFVDADNGGVQNGDTVIWIISNLEPDSIINLQVRLRADDLSNGTFRNWAEIGEDSSEDYGLSDDDSTPDYDGTNDPANDHDMINLDAAAADEDDSDFEDVYPIPMEYDLALIKTADPLEVEEGGTVTFTITVANQGSLDAHDFTVVDFIPGGMSFVSANNGAVELNGEVTWIIPELEPNETIELEVVLRADDISQGPFRNWAEITDDSSEDYSLMDDDSTPDRDPNNDQASDHDQINLDTAAGDEDDSDFEIIYIIQPGLIPDTIYITTPYGTPITNICADLTELPGNYVNTKRCGDPDNGFLQVNSLDNCVNYTPDQGFVGTDEACIIVCDDNNPQVCDTTYIIITVEPSNCEDLFSESENTLYTDCGELITYCVDLLFADVSNYRITDNGSPYTNTLEECATNSNNFQVSVDVGYHMLVFLDLTTGCSDSVALTVNCPVDSVIRNTVRVDDFDEICFDGYLPGDIISIENTCPESAGNANVSINTIDNCVTYTGVTIGLDTSCIKVCTAPDTCTVFTVITTVIDACEDLVFEDSLMQSIEYCDDTARVCLPIPIADVILNYSVQQNGEPYLAGYEGCDFDSTFTYTYFTIPGQGNSGPYRVDSWEINGQVFSGEVNDLADLVDSMNVWDDGNTWSIQASTYLLVSELAINTYGNLNITQIATGSVGRLEVNEMLLPKGSSIKLLEGEHEIILRDNISGCEDTLFVDIRCLNIDIVYDTITVMNTDTICIDSSELRGKVVSMENDCDESSGEYVIYNVLDDELCLEIEGVDIGVDSACVVVCDSLGICDTTYIFVTVLPQMIDAVNDADTLTENSPGKTYPILDNDTISGNLDTIYLVTKPLNGAVTLNDAGTVSYIPDESYCDSEVPDSLQYAICNQVGCDTATVYFYVFCEDLVIYTGFSPNEDGVGDFFFIEGIEGYPNNTLTIFNRWGNQVFHTDGYKNDWKGTWNGKDLPDGTYFYMLDDGQGRSFTGYVQIHR